VGNSERLVSEVIATAHGDVPSLAESGDFRATTESLPEDRLGVAYVNVGSLVSRLGELGGAAGTSFAGPSLTGVDPSVLKGLAVAVRARPDGLELDTTGTLDPTKLTPEMRTALEADGDPSAVLSEVPSDAYGVIAVTGLKEQIDAALAQFGGTSNPALAQLGLTGPDGVLEHLTGSAAIEAEPGTGRYPTGAIVIGTDDPVGMQSFLDNLSVIAAQSFAAPQFGAGFGGAGRGSNSQSLIETDALESAPASWSRSTYHGVSISSIQIPGDVGIEPAYAVVNDAGIVAASPEAVRAVIDAHEGGGLSSEGDFEAALAAVGGMDESLVYVNVADVASAVREALPPDERAQFDRDIAPNLAPLEAFVTGGESDSSGSRQRTVLLVK
jgi:hypothetical protein